MSSNVLLEDWLKSCVAIISISLQSILAMNLLKDFKLVFTQKQMAQVKF